MRGQADLLITPSLPFTGSTDSTRIASQLAAERAGKSAVTERGRVFDCLKSYPLAGATDKEMQTALGMDGSTQRPRRIELLRAGLIRDMGCKRDGCTVWGIV